MKLASLKSEGGSGSSLVAVLDDEFVDLGAALPGLPGDVGGLLELGPSAIDRVKTVIDGGGHRSPLDPRRLASPLARPPKFLAIGLNYADHIAETGAEAPEFPNVFAKMTTCVAGPYDDVLLPSVSDQLDYEGELGFVIATRCRHISRERARDVIAGYVVINDYSVRDYQLRTSQWLLGKSFDTHGVIGPWLVTADEVADPHALPIRTLVNGELRQSSNTSNLIFDCFDAVALLSSVFTLEPGDVVATGTPSGVAMATGHYLVAGDGVRVEIDGIGAIENRIVPEPDLTQSSIRAAAAAAAAQVS
jgi:2-keto-4-pentenoate hydratase/2-oxohepta-3-ene-1,7-dioic acid hydratase in catechol pathway